MLSSAQAVVLKQAHESLQREEEKERLPAGGGKTKGKVSEEQERERGNRGRMGEEKKTGGRLREREALCWGSYRSHWFLVVHPARPV